MNKNKDTVVYLKEQVEALIEKKLKEDVKSLQKKDLENEVYKKLKQDIERLSFFVGGLIAVGELEGNREILGYKLDVLQETFTLLEEVEFLMESLISKPTKH
tara:strand:- start:888 stop:1193 length:306 start_codon:yes stop_codon:yes gene_type:complete